MGGTLYDASTFALNHVMDAGELNNKTICTHTHI